MIDLAELERSISRAHREGDRERLLDLQRAYRSSRASVIRTTGLPIGFTSRTSGTPTSIAGGSTATQAASSTQTDVAPTIVRRAPWRIDSVPPVTIAAEVYSRLSEFEDEIGGCERTSWLFGEIGSRGSIFVTDLDCVWTGESPFSAVARGRGEAIDLAQRRRCHVVGLLHSHPEHRASSIEPSVADLLCFQSNAQDANRLGIFVAGVVVPNRAETPAFHWHKPLSAWWLTFAKAPDRAYEVHPRVVVAA